MYTYRHVYLFADPMGAKRYSLCRTGMRASGADNGGCNAGCVVGYLFLTLFLACAVIGGGCVGYRRYGGTVRALVVSRARIMTPPLSSTTSATGGEGPSSYSAPFMPSPS